MNQKNIWLAVLVAALGYFVDVYDIVIFTVVRTQSLQALGISGDDLTFVGIKLLNIQLLGMLVGGILWGVVGDKKGRTSVLFGSIILYSISNLLNAFVKDLTSYQILRFLAGLGLAGELGAGVTLVNELLKKEVRGIGTMIVATSGVFGGIVAGLIGNSFDWKIAYLIGGTMGFLLLLLRWSVKDSPLFLEIKEKRIVRGDFASLFRNPALFGKYVKCLGLGTPIWIFIGIFIALAPEIAKELSVVGSVSAGSAILFFNIGFGIGDVASSCLSQFLKSRRKAAGSFILLTFLAAYIFLNLRGASQSSFYAACVFLGIGAGYWAVFLAIATEQFGTNLRATVTTSLPNFVRGLVIPVSIFVQVFRLEMGLVPVLNIVAFVLLVVALLCLAFLDETFDRNLAFAEL